MEGTEAIFSIIQVYGERDMLRWNAERPFGFCQELGYVGLWIGLPRNNRKEFVLVYPGIPIDTANARDWVKILECYRKPSHARSLFELTEPEKI